MWLDTYCLMKTIQIDLSGKYLQNEIPTNSIFFKNLTGIGATHIELNIAKRNSLIIEPNVPVIEGKTSGRNDLLGVYEGITTQDIERYLRSNTKFKKIVTTPESLSKIMIVFEAMEIDYLNTYFMLIDECERLIRDAEYRKTILFPLEFFFKFKHKAFVSATAIIPSDPRFKNHKFSIYNVVPTYGIKKDLNVTTTNHTVSSINKAFKTSKADKVFIFLNSIVGSASIIKSLGIASESSIFTSSDGIKDYKNRVKGVTPKHLTDTLDKEKFSKYNFLTSRYFSAVDIDIEECVDILIISDLNSFKHSLIAPQTDLIQIVGRIRNKEYIASINFIVNIPKTIEYTSQESIEKAFNFGIQLRDFLKTASLSTDNQDIKDFMKQIIQINGDKAFFNEDFNTNYFMMDNFRYENLVKSFYASEQRLIEIIGGIAISGTDKKYFKVNHISDVFDLSQTEVKFKSAKMPFKDKFEELISLMENIQESKKESFETPYQVDNSIELEKKIMAEYFEMYEIFLNDGADKLREIGNTQKAIKDYYYLNYDNSHLDKISLIRDLYRKFTIGQEYTQKECLDIFFEIFLEYNPKESRTIIHIERYFEIERFKKRLNRNPNQTRMIKIISPKFNVA